MWPCPDQERPDGLGLLAAWLHTAVVKIVTTYSQPGDRVLLLSAPMIAGTSPVLANEPRTSSPELAGLSEAGWTVARLGRGVRTWTGGPPPKDDSAGPAVPAEFESGPRLAAPSADPATPDPDADRFGLIITTVVPNATEWIETVPWTRVLEPGGTLAVVTHSDIAAGCLVDPTGRLVTTIRDRGFSLLDHVILLKNPITETTVHPAPPTGTEPWIPLRHTRVHDDLLLFTPARTEEDSSDE